MAVLQTPFHEYVPQRRFSVVPPSSIREIQVSITETPWEIPTSSTKFATKARFSSEAVKQEKGPLIHAYIDPITFGTVELRGRHICVRPQMCFIFPFDGVAVGFLRSSRGQAETGRPYM